METLNYLSFFSCNQLKWDPINVTVFGLKSFDNKHVCTKKYNEQGDHDDALEITAV